MLLTLRGFGLIDGLDLTTGVIKTALYYMKDLVLTLPTYFRNECQNIITALKTNQGLTANCKNKMKMINQYILMSRKYRKQKS